MPETREIVYNDGEHEVKLVVGAASVLAGMKRALLTGRAMAYLETLSSSSATGQAETVDSAATSMVARMLYPDCLPAVVAAEGLDAEMDVANFLQLPEALTDAWQNAVYDLNPHWYPFRREGEDEAQAIEKKAPDSASSESDS